MAGYTRQDTANNIANGNVIDADDLDAEYNAIENAFNISTGHKHDGSAGGGAPIDKVGPSQDLVVTGTELLPKSTNTLDLGTSDVQFKDAWFDGTVDTDDLTVAQDASIGGILTVGSGVVSDVTGTLTGNVIGNLTGAVTGTVSDLSNHSTDDLSEGVQRLYYTDARARAALSATGSLNYDSLTGVISFTQGNTDTIPEGNTNLYYTPERAIADVGGSFSIVDNGGDGSLALEGSAITYTGPSPEEVRAHFSGGTGIVINDGEVAIDANGNPTLSSLVITGDLVVQGSTTSVSSEDVNTTSTFIVLNVDEAGVPSANSGIEVERGTSANKKFFWDETNDRWSTGGDPLYAPAIIGNASTATKLATARTLALTGDVTGSVSFDGASNATITATVADDSHNHTIANVDGLQTALNGKASSAQGSLANTAVQPGDNVTLGNVSASSFSGNAGGLTGIPANRLTGSLPSINGASLTGMYGNNGAARAFIAFNGATGGVIRKQNVSLSKSSTGNYTLTISEPVRASSYCVVVGAVDKGISSQTPVGVASFLGQPSATSQSTTQAAIYTAYVSGISSTTITIRGRNLYNQYWHFGGNDHNTGTAWGITGVDPTYIAVAIY